MPTYTLVSTGAQVVGTGPLVVPRPGTYDSGDLLLLCACARADSEVSDTDPATFTRLQVSAGGGFEVWGLIAAGGESDPSISFDGSTRCAAFMAALHSSTGWPVIGSCVIDSNVFTSGAITAMRYASLTVSQDNLCVVQIGTKQLTTANTNPATAVNVTFGWSALGFAANNAVSSGVAIAGQFQSQTSATNASQSTETITGNSDSGNPRGISLSLIGAAAAPPATIKGAALMMGVG